MNEAQKEKKKWYKSKWIWIVAIVMLFYSIMNACQNNSAFNEELTAIQDHISQNQFSEAETKLKAIKSSHSNNPSVYVTYADFYVAQNNYLSALNILDEGHDAVYVTGDYDATSEKREVIDDKIKEVACKYAETYENTGDYITAIDILFQRKLEDEVKEKFYKYADYYENQKDYQKAIELYQKAVNDYSSFFSGIFKKKDLRAKIEALTEQMRKAEPEEPKTDAILNDNINSSEETSIEEDKKTQNEYISALGNIYTGVKVYSRESEEYYLGTIMDIDDNYKGIKGNKAVYVTGGLLEGWYARNVAIQTWYVKSNDPALPYNKN